MTGSLRLAVIFVLLTTAATTAFSDPPPKQATTWRLSAPDHYYNNQCCYCRHADSTGPSDREGYGIYWVDGKGYEMPDSVIRTPDPKKPTRGIIICDPVKREYQCVLSDNAT